MHGVEQEEEGMSLLRLVMLDVMREVDMFILATVHLRNCKNSMRTLQCLFIMMRALKWEL